MPKIKPKPGSRKVELKMFIVCEGAKDKSEHAYLDKFVKDCRFRGNKVEIILVDTQKNTGKELVERVIQERKNDGIPDDHAWVVYDKDGYEKHAETFSLAQKKNVRIAFSSISFETWILLHFEYTTKAFPKSDDIISYLKHKKYLDYTKGSDDVYLKTKHLLDSAITHAERIRTHQNNSAPINSSIYDLNPYTDFDLLIKQIIELQEK